MSLQELVDIQRKFDKDLYLKFNETGIETLDSSFLALKVELGELANEVRCFKYWSIKKSSSKEIVGLELVDVLRFLISIGITLNFKIHLQPSPFELDEEPNNTLLTKVFNQLFDTIMRMESAYLDDEIQISSLFYRKILNEYFSLAHLLGFSEKEIYDYSIRKHEINIQRQLQNY